MNGYVLSPKTASVSSRVFVYLQMRNEPNRFTTPRQDTLQVAASWPAMRTGNGAQERNNRSGAGRRRYGMKERQALTVP